MNGTRKRTEVTKTSKRQRVLTAAGSVPSHLSVDNKRLKVSDMLGTIFSGYIFCVLDGDFSVEQSGSMHSYNRSELISTIQKYAGMVVANPSLQLGKSDEVSMNCIIICGNCTKGHSLQVLFSTVSGKD
jgi:hypothetical protein